MIVITFVPVNEFVHLTPLVETKAKLFARLAERLSCSDLVITSDCVMRLDTDIKLVAVNFPVEVKLVVGTKE